jgi:hypothetical protein
MVSSCMFYDTCEVKISTAYMDSVKQYKVIHLRVFFGTFSASCWVLVFESKYVAVKSYSSYDSRLPSFCLYTFTSTECPT